MSAFGPFGLLRGLRKHSRFYFRRRVLRRREVAMLVGLATVAVVAEAGGLAMILPILSFVEQGRDVEAFAESSFLAGFIVDAYQWVGAPVSIISLSVCAFLFISLRQATIYVNVVETERIKWSIGRRLSVRLFEAVLGSDAANIRGHKPGEFTVLSDYECQAAAAIARVYASLWMQILSFAAYGAVLVATAPLASLLGGAIIALATLCLGFLIRRTRRISLDGVDIRRTHVDFLNERFRAWKLIKLGGTLPQELEKVDKVAGRVARNRVRLARLSGLMMLTFVPAMSAFVLTVLYVFVEVLVLDVAQVTLFVLVLLRLMPVSQAFQKQLALLAQFDPSLDLVEGALQRAGQRRESLDEGQDVPGIEREIRFEGVSFAYPDRDHAALSDVSIAIPAHRMTAVIGRSGAGKSTLVDLIPRLILPSQGRLSVDGVPIDQVSLRSLRRMIAFVPQEPFLFDASLADNIRYLRPDATDTEVAEAARLADAADFIEALPEGYATGLGDAGGKLSGGQKQRIVLARALVSGAPILILDEPTSALDYATEANIQHTLENLVSQHGRTIIVIAHRLSTVRNADFVILLEEGRVAKSGPASRVIGKDEVVQGAIGNWVAG